MEASIFKRTFEKGLKMWNIEKKKSGKEVIVISSVPSKKIRMAQRRASKRKLELQETFKNRKHKND